MKVLIIIPAYNEADNLAVLLKKLKMACPGYDAVVINDDSGDDTSYVARQHGVDVIDLPVNLGIGGAVQCGLKYAGNMGYDVAVQVDGDGQHDPACISILVDAVKNGADLCIGSRFIANKGYRSTPLRRFAIRYFSRLIHVFTGLRITDPTSGFRAFGKKAIRLFAREYPQDYPEPESIVNAVKKKLKIVEAPVIMNERKEGRSSITAVKSVYYMVKVSLSVFIASFYSKGLPEADRP